MGLADLTSRDAALRAIAEYDKVGREAFLSHHGYAPARSYYLVHEGRMYDSKAIAGVAYGLQFPDQGPLSAADFSGGERRVQPVLLRRQRERLADGRLDPVAAHRLGSVERYIGCAQKIARAQTSTCSCATENRDRRPRARRPRKDCSNRAAL